MSKQRHIEFANFTCKFGNQKVLLDLAREVVIPAFQPGFFREYKDNKFFFLDTRLVNLAFSDDPILAIVGRFIRNTYLEREQIYKEDQGLVKDHQVIASSPSALFALILNNHKLLYLHETGHAPTLEAFRATASKFIRERHKSFIDELLRIAKKEKRRLKKRDLLEDYPYPSVEIVPLSSYSSLTDFIRKYDILRTVVARLTQTNDEIDTNPFFLTLRSMKDRIGSRQTAVSHYNKEGLSKDETISQIAPAVAEGNVMVDFRGVGLSGQVLNGNNDNFKVRVPIDDIPEDIGDAAKVMHDVFKNLTQDGTIKIAEPSDGAIDKVLVLTDMIDKK